MFTLEEATMKDNRYFPEAAQGVIAVGLEIKFLDGQPVVYYPDGTKVPDNLHGSALVWHLGHPVTLTDHKCVGYRGGKLASMPCEGYHDGVDNSKKYLGYICEARPIETLKDDVPKACHFPFVYNSVTHVNCVQEPPTGEGKKHLFLIV